MTDVKKYTDELRIVLAESDLPEVLLARYDLLECLAVHKACETYLASERQTGQFYIVKCYDKSQVKLMPSEELLRSLNHPFLPVYAGSFENDRMKCMVRTYIEGTPLSDYARERELSEQEVVGICIQLADILIFLHSRTPPVIHRDIKPENIIITGDGKVALIDFDIARTVRDEAESDTLFFGTRGYAPPEQYGFAQTDCRADIYSFGVLLRFLLTDSIRPNRKVRLYPPLQRIIDKCTAFAPEQRYSDMQAVRRALAQANPRVQMIQLLRRAAFIALIAALSVFAGVRIYQRVTYSPFKDGSVIPSVMPDNERQAEAVAYLTNKFDTHLFDDTASYFTIGRLKDILVEVYHMDEDYARIPSSVDPPNEVPEHFMPWSLGDEQNTDRDHLAYFVTKVYWPDTVADWSGLKEDTGAYPGIVVAGEWCKRYSILTGVNRPTGTTVGEAAIAFANADKVYETLKTE